MIIVTGSQGRVGRAICEELNKFGYEWQGVDIRAIPEFVPSGRFAHRKCDLAVYGEAMEALDEATAVIHAAAIAYPRFHPEHVTFSTNMSINFNVFKAATERKIAKVVWLSSEKVYGYPFARCQPVYFPIDEDHPLRCEDAYAISKRLSEELANDLAAVSETSFVSLRSTLVQDTTDYCGYAKFSNQPEMRLWALWSYIDVRDLARACRLALEASLVGSHVFSLASKETMSQIPSLELAERFFPGVETRWPRDASPFASFCNSGRIMNAIGFEPTFHWKDGNEK